ncbi:DUF1538 domain-containing protein [Perlabentimonas gracilis]|uniref:DUF1538 domain-containing protein n=1 Tax=Perlabentimonas gracilis TaxID=2715279 RepID=UPI00140B0C69|nr:DUF1538 domain-containing protein [Perlabentimonas gracilis]NHB67434.1 DUF1538 domain-containing protein [Perlabentimonas gracilis]
MKKRIKIPFKSAFGMLGGYAKDRIVEQIRLIAFVIVYLVTFQVLILQVPLADALPIAGGIGLVVFGLAFFLEGLLLGLMPLGERVGVKLPTKFGILFIAVFGIFLGFGSTVAEPAISSLRTAGAGVTAWDAPMLYMLLERYTQALVYSIGGGVGLAVALGMFRFYYELSIKPFIYTIIPVVLALSLFLSFDSILNSIIGLAWDSGAVTTGAVTVPLVLALGIGVSRAASKNKASSGGFGIILLASAFPILSVLILGISLRSASPEQTTEAHFFSKQNRVSALKLFDDDNALLQHAFTRGSEVGRKSYFADLAQYENTLQDLANNPETLTQLLGTMSLDEWLSSKASEDERKFIASVKTGPIEVASGIPASTVFKEESKISLQAVIPLTLLLLVVLLLFLREKLRYKDEFVLGIMFTLIGMALLTSGIRLGLGPLGGQVGAQLPRAFSKEAKFIESKMITPFDTSLVFSSISLDGTTKQFFNLVENDDVKTIEFFPEKYDKENKIYEYVIKRQPLLGPNLTLLGILLVLLFAFGMGFGATMAEPGLNALGITVEELTVGAIKRSQILFVVSLGVGIGLVLGVLRILYDIPLIWMILPGYLLLLPLTYFSEDEFTSIAWDCGGVTTGPVTVPLVLAMGLSIGGELNVVDGFGILACASFSPIVTVLTFGLITRARQKRIVNTSTDNHDE